VAAVVQPVRGDIGFLLHLGEQATHVGAIERSTDVGAEDEVLVPPPVAGAASFKQLPFAMGYELLDANLRKRDRASTVPRLGFLERPLPAMALKAPSDWREGPGSVDGQRSEGTLFAQVLDVKLVDLAKCLNGHGSAITVTSTLSRGAPSPVRGVAVARP
jgi:hypothetical protein